MCECGQITGVPCRAAPSLDPDAVVEFFPPWVRAAHVDAGKMLGSFPHNGAIRLRLRPECAGELEQAPWCVAIDRRSIRVLTPFTGKLAVRGEELLAAYPHSDPS